MSPPASSGAPSRLTQALGLLTLGAAMVGSTAVLRARPELLETSVTAARDAGPVGMAAFVVVVALTTVIGVPATFPTLAAGFAWGPWKGTLLVWPGAVLGALGAFALSRWLMRATVERWVARDARFQAVDRAVHDEGGRLAMLLRLSPATPFNVTNFAFGVTSIGWGAYAWSTAVGILPGTVLYVYFGSTLESVSAIASGRRPLGEGPGVLSAVGLVATVLATVWLTRAAKRALERAPPP